MLVEVLSTLVICEGAVLIAMQMFHMKERTNLLDRLIARDLPELVTFQNERQKNNVVKETEDSHLVSM